jgi:hypothetical protein
MTMTDIQLLKTGFKPWLSPADRARLTVLLAEQAALRDGKIDALGRDATYCAAEATLDAANAHYRAVHNAQKEGRASQSDLDAAYQLRKDARLAMERAYNSVQAQFDSHLRKM